VYYYAPPQVITPSLSESKIQLTAAHEIQITNNPIRALISVVFPFFTFSSSPPAVRIWNPPYIANITAIRAKNPSNQVSKELITAPRLAPSPVPLLASSTLA